MGTFTSFVIFAEMRTGSNHLEESLNLYPGLRCHGEVFNPWFIGREGQTEALGVTLAGRDRDPVGFLARMRTGTPGIAGFRFFHDHDPRVPDLVLPDRRCAKVILTRDPLESYVSWKIADATGFWRVTDTRDGVAARVRFDPAEFADLVERQEAFRHRVTRALATSGQVPFRLDYADINDIEVLNGLARFLGVDHRRAAPSTRLKRQNPGPLRDKVTNPEEMDRALAEMGRAPGTATAMPPIEPVLRLSRLADAPPLLAIGLPGGPDAALRRFLDLQQGAGPGPQDRAALRQWLNRTKRRTVLAVVSHPVTRAWRLHLSALAEGETATRESFGAFLAGLAATGTPALAVSPAAPQVALLAALAPEVIPDLTLREEALGPGLADLAARTGARPPEPAATEPTLAALAAVHDAQIEQAVRALYTPDYRSFGYRGWEPQSDG